MEKKKKKIELNAFAIIFCIMIFCALLTWIIPAGQFETAFDEVTGRDLVVPGTYQQIESTPVGPWKLITSLFDGFVDAADIMFFIVFASSYVYVLTKSNAMNAMTGAMLRKIGSHDNLIIPIFMTFFAIGGTTFGMFEETYALIPAFIVIAITLGYDRIVGGAIVYLGISVGFSAAILNPFTIGVASDVANVPLVGTKITIFRTIAFILFLALAIAYVMHYASKIKKDPTKSILYGHHEDITGLMTREECMNVEFTTVHKISMLGFLLLIVILVWGIISQGWWLGEIASLFFVFMLVTAFINKMKPNEIAETFVESTRAAMYGVLLVGFSRGISMVMAAGSIIDTVVYALGNLVGSLPTTLTGIGMLIVQNLINFFIPSGSGQAVVMMPIMAPLADVVNMSREMSVVAFQFGDGFSNMIWPTAVATECGIMGISLGHWYKFVLKLFGMMFALQCILMVAGVLIGI